MRRKTAHSMFLFTVRCSSDAGMGINCSHCTRRNFCWSCILFCATPNDPYQILWTNEHLSSSSSWRYFQQLILVFFFLIKIKLFIILRILFTVLNFTQTHILLFFSTQIHWIVFPKLLRAVYSNWVSFRIQIRFSWI